MHTSMTIQNIKTVWYALGTKSTFHNVIALNINCPPEKLMLVVTVQLPTSVNHPVIQDAKGAHFLVESIALQ